LILLHYAKNGYVITIEQSCCYVNKTDADDMWVSFPYAFLSKGEAGHHWMCTTYAGRR